jgi:hypothetical protein
MCAKESLIDKSDWIASLTGVNPMNNGNLCPYAYGMCQNKHAFKKGSGAFHRIVPELAKYLMMMQNLLVRNKTLNVPHEVF